MTNSDHPTDFSPLVDNRESEKKTTYNGSNSDEGVRDYTGFISRLTRRDQSGNVLWFARVGYFNGYHKKEEGEEYAKRKISNADVLLSKTLIKWAESVYVENGDSNLPNGYMSVIHKMRIKNLDYEAVIVDGKPYLQNKGILEGFSVGS